MKPDIKKVRTTMQVATIFTGAAAGTAVFAPAALAGTAPLAHQPVLKGVPQTVRPDISQRSCRPGTSNWFHLAYGQVSDTCFGFRGTIHTTYYATSFCGGNNNGWIKGRLDNGTGKSYFTYFGHGTFYAHIPNTSAGQSKALKVVSVHISSWSGTDRCGFP